MIYDYSELNNADMEDMLISNLCETVADEVNATTNCYVDCYDYGSHHRTETTREISTDSECITLVINKRQLSEYFDGYEYLLECIKDKDALKEYFDGYFYDDGEYKYTLEQNGILSIDPNNDKIKVYFDLQVEEK